MAAKRKRKSQASSTKRREFTGHQHWMEIVAFVMGGLGLLHFLALISYSPYDLPSWVPISRDAHSDAAGGNFIGPFGALVAGYSYFLFGAACYLLPTLIVWFGVASILGFRIWTWKTGAAVFGFIISAACLVDFQPLLFETWVSDYNLPGSKGGFIGYLVGQLFAHRFLGPVGGALAMTIIYLICLIIITGIPPLHFLVMVRAEAEAYVSRKIAERKTGVKAERPQAKRASKKKEKEEQQEFEVIKRANRKTKPDPEPEKNEPEPDRPEPKIIDASVRSPRKKGAKGEPDSLGASFGSGGDAFKNYRLPSLDLLDYDEPDDAAKPADTSKLIETQNIIVETLETFGLKVSPGDITRGPTITRYEIYPAKGLRVKQITALEPDLARATRAERINIIAPIPGKDTVGIEIANSDKVLVPLRELLEDGSFLKGKAHIPLALGKDVYGKAIVADLAAMPHLLVAGATGSGKSVCINSIIASLLFRFSPEELRFIMVDPKVVEMQMFNALPHLAVPVVTNPKKVLLALRWCLNEMERRYELFAKAGVRKLEEFNKRGTRKRKSRAPKDEPPPVSASAVLKQQEEESFLPEGAVSHAVKTESENSSDNNGEDPEIDMPERLPYVVVIIDELADLMQTAPADVETSIARLCQKARAAGIHLIVATQSPRADVITGLIKANIPSRIAFQVASATDSRVILDKAGAEKLVGKGDLLYHPPDSAVLTRSQGAFITDDEIQDIVDHCAKQAEPVFESDIQETLEQGSDDETELTPQDEEAFEKCLEVVLMERKASTSFLQRRLRLGYTRAARMMDILEERGVVGPGDGAKPREILVATGDQVD